MEMGGRRPIGRMRDGLKGEWKELREEKRRLCETGE